MLKSKVKGMSLGGGSSQQRRPGRVGQGGRRYAGECDVNRIKVNEDIDWKTSPDGGPGWHSLAALVTTCSGRGWVWAEKCTWVRKPDPEYRRLF